MSEILDTFRELNRVIYITIRDSGTNLVLTGAAKYLARF